MRDQFAIQLRGVSKTFYIRENSNDSIREKVKGLFNLDNSIKKIEALKDVTFDIKKGEFFGIIGHNGSGKSTLLKLIIGAIQADKGSTIITEGRVLRLALGMGFDMNLSARHNIYVNGSIMGLTFKEIGKRFQEIIDFAGLQDFVDTPIKFYSSGMISRLSFAISVHVESEILLIDEFFGGVGDVGFKQKSEEMFKRRILEGKTVVFVSHSMETIKEHCERVCVLNKGTLVGLGAPADVIPEYIASYN